MSLRSVRAVSPVVRFVVVPIAAVVVVFEFFAVRSVQAFRSA